MKYIEGTARNQLCLFADSLDSLIPEDHIVRFIDKYIDSLDLEKMGLVGYTEERGRPSYHPGLYFKIFVYSYLIKIRSSRKIEAECKRNIELIWLTGQLAPDFWSLSNFRKRNLKVVKHIFRDFLNRCYKMELMSFKLAAIDGTKMRGQNSNHNVYTRAYLEKQQQQMNKKINEYLHELEENDRVEECEYDFLSGDIIAKIEKIEDAKLKLAVIEEVLEKDPEMEKYFANDPETMFQNDKGKAVCGYNGQIAVDDKNKLIIATDVVTENSDRRQLNNMQSKINDIKEDCQSEEKTICVADAGYYSEAEIVESEETKNMDTYIPHPKDVKTKEKAGRHKPDKVPAKGFEQEDFKYDEISDTFTCPQGMVLTRKGNGTIKNGLRKYQYTGKDCNNCEHKSYCTTNKRGRYISISENFLKMNRFRNKVLSEKGRKIIRRRKALVEHPFGTIKRNFGYTYFMLKGRENACSEFSLMALTYNMKRLINIMGVKRMIEAF